jgi:hypothetical protein
MELKYYVTRKLREKNVDLMAGYPIRVRLKCKKCGVEWSPDLQESGCLPRRYWACPEVCNA